MSSVPCLDGGGQRGHCTAANRKLGDVPLGQATAVYLFEPFSSCPFQKMVSISNIERTSGCQTLAAATGIAFIMRVLTPPLPI